MSLLKKLAAVGSIAAIALFRSKHKAPVATESAAAGATSAAAGAAAGATTAAAAKPAKRVRRKGAKRRTPARHVRSA